MRRILTAMLLLVSTLLVPSQVISAQAAAAAEPPFAALVFSKTAGFRHTSIPAGIAAIKQLGQEHGFTVDATEDSAAFTEANLAKYQVVVFLSTTGDVLDATQQTAFEHYIEGGGGFAGVHAAADTEYDWAWYGKLVGAYFKQHPAPQQATVKVEDPAHPSTAGLPAQWSRNDEWYDFRTDPRGAVHVLTSMDETSYSGGTMGADHPNSWCQNYDGGRSWYTALGHTDESFAEPNFLKMLLGGLQTAAGVVPADCSASLDSAFAKVTLDDNTSNPMMLDVAADGTVFYIDLVGDVKAVKPGGGVVTSGHLDVFTANESGLLGLALDPAFATNRWAYLYYSPQSKVVDRLSRFTVKPDLTLDLTSEKVVLEVPVQRAECCHHGGGMVFDKATGDLWLANGDNTNPFASDGYTPIDERAGRDVWDAQGSAANSNDLRGKVLRIHPQPDGTYTIPAGNLFPPGTAKTRPEIYGMGFRNPFRIGIDPKTHKLLVANYGPDAGQPSATRGPENTVEWDILNGPGFYGWPYCVGNNKPYIDFDFATNTSKQAFDCAAPKNDSPNNTGITDLPAAKAATVYYHYAADPAFPELGGGGAPMAGPAYRYDPALVSDRKWPAYWDGKAVFGEWNQNYLYSFQLSADGSQLVDINPMLTSMSFKKPMDMKFGPDGALYLIEWGSGFGGNNTDSGIYRIDYTKGNRAPIAQAKADKTSGPVPLAVKFTSAGSADPDGTPLTYAWDFDGNGSVDSTEANPAYTYTTAGNFAAVLTVKDQGGKTATANVPIVAGNTVPTVTINLPPNGSLFDFGAQVKFTVTVTDPEDGTIDCANVKIQAILGHDTHGHPLDQYTGCSGTVQTTLSSGHSDGDNIFYVLEASYTDHGGAGSSGPLTGRAQTLLQPKHKEAEFFTTTGRAPDGTGTGDSGVQVETTSDPQGGFNDIGSIEDGDYWTHDPVNLTGIDSLSFRAASASTGGTIEVRAGAVDGPLVGKATVTSTGGWQTFQDFPVTLTNPPTTSGPLYFVVRKPAGSTNNGALLNVNWTDFIGSVNGITLRANPTSLSFGSRITGTTSPAQAVTVTNSGTAAATLNGVTVTGDYAQTNTCGTSLAAGASCTVNVTFTPTASGSRPGSLNVASNVGALTVGLSGSGVTSTTNLALGATMTASSSASGYPPSNANDNDTSTYWESANNAFPQWLQADLGSTQSIGSITLKLPPPAVWASRTQTLSIQTSTNNSTWTTVKPSASYTFDPATGNSVTIPLTTTDARQVRLNFTANTGWPAAQVAEFQIFPGTGNPTQNPSLSASPGSLSFASRDVGSTSPAQAVTVTNNGTATANLGTVATTGDFAQTKTCGTTLAAGASCTVNVTFTPTASGSRTGTLTVASNDPNSPLTVTLSGTGATASNPNLAQGRPTTETSHVQTYGSGNAVDGNASTYWESANNAFPQSITVDLGSATSVGRIVMKLPPATAWATRSQTVAVTGSTDNSTYTSVVGATSYTFNPSTGNTATITFPATSRRYLRLTFSANTGWPAGQLSEFEVYAS
ncbi:ThuA domain-containing protein [Sphaerisporangium perillae]|uniref:ThuA domain-containing protein n=1 Tax=Sphaerisporangium perillae TaxID=2935860 RepID=UPI00200DE786|nr:ThuA domain-containing protein [Sphaerisporangium perillae]